MSVKQNTLKGEFSLKGKGLHTGKEVCATFKPAAENTGYKIVRVDLEEKTEIPALAKYIELVDRASCLQKDGAKVLSLIHISIVARSIQALAPISTLSSITTLPICGTLL